MVYKDGKPIITTVQIQSVNLTWDEYQALPATKLTDGVYYNITDWEQSTLDIVNVLTGENIALQSRIAELENKNVYSTDEMRVGTWIDGKPIYRSVITSTHNGSSNAWDLVCDDNLSYIQRIVRAEQSRGTYFINPLVERRTDGKLYVFSASGLVIGELFILEYTKTTD